MILLPDFYDSRNNSTQGGRNDPLSDYNTIVIGVWVCVCLFKNFPCLINQSIVIVVIVVVHAETTAVVIRIIIVIVVVVQITKQNIG